MNIEMDTDPSDNLKDDEDKEVQLPGFRFHPTDEELVGFYLRRKVEKKPISIELIKQIDIYKFDPWDLPKVTSRVGDNESYFYCKRGRKYRNSIRPNRVTGSGFWKATGIDKPVYNNYDNLNTGSGLRSEHHHRCIGLKKTLVYYRGSAGKGVKTDWMMHEFRLPSIETNPSNNLGQAGNTGATTNDASRILPEAEVWTLCRIFKRNISSRKYTPDWKELAGKRLRILDGNSTKTSNTNKDSNNINHRQDNYISFGGVPTVHHNHDHHQKNPKPSTTDDINILHASQLRSSTMISSQPSTLTLESSSSFSNIINDHDNDELFKYGNWDELRSVVEFALDP